jgi:hypothetical protein
LSNWGRPAGRSPKPGAWEGTLISARADRSGAALNTVFDLVFGALLT